MSTKYSGGIITKNPVTPAGPYETGAAPGVWTVEQALQYTKQGIWPTQGNVPNYIEDVFSTWLYTGNGSTQTITNGINLSANGGLVWIKNRTGANSHTLFDSATYTTGQYYLASNLTNGLLNTGTPGTFVLNSTGFSLGSGPNQWNGSGQNLVSWSFRKQPKFFDVVTWSGNGVIGRTISHNLGSVPGCIIVKKTTAAGDWPVYHAGLGATKAMILNLSDSVYTWNVWNDTTPTSTVFSLNDASEVNGAGANYVAYLFAHDAGGFGLTGTDNVISCGIFTSDASGGCNVNLGYEPQWILSKSSTIAVPWAINDTMRGFTSNNTNNSRLLYANTSGAEVLDSYLEPTSTGFKSSNQLQASAPYIYIAIRRGPMKVPTVGTSVFSPVAQTNTGSQPFSVTAGFPVDSAWFGQRNGWGVNFITSDRLRGATNLLLTTSTNSEATNNSTYGPSVSKLDSNTKFFDGMTNASEPDIYWMMGRAPSFFDEVCYTGTGANTTFTHNLGVVPEMMIVKGRSVNANWSIYTATTGATKSLFFTDVAAGTYSVVWNDTAPTASVFTVGTAGTTNSSGGTYVAYLFATCAGVSKVGSYTGTGATQTINCGFGASGSRFVLVKRTDSTGDWYVWDSARGMVSGTDPSLLLNSTAAEVNANSVYAVSTGFQIVSTAAGINASGGSYIFLSIA